MSEKDDMMCREQINDKKIKLKKINKLIKRKLLNLKKLPEVSNGKGDDACVKEKRIFPLENGDDIIFLFQAVSVEPTTLILLSGVWGTTLRHKT